jgi:hypothetical protein
MQFDFTLNTPYSLRPEEVLLLQELDAPKLAVIVRMLDHAYRAGLSSRIDEIRNAPPLRVRMRAKLSPNVGGPA